jgi:hypothetical protein
MLRIETQMDRLPKLIYHLELDNETGSYIPSTFELSGGQSGPSLQRIVWQIANKHHI